MRIYPRFPGFWPFHCWKKNGLGGNIGEGGGDFGGYPGSFSAAIFLFCSLHKNGREMVVGEGSGSFW